MADKNENSGPGMEVNVNLDTTPVLYTDNIMMVSNEDGLVLDICQRMGNTNQVRVVSRIGMSREHAWKFLKALGDLLNVSDGKIQTGKAVRA